MSRPRLHLDADASFRALHRALVARGHDVTRTPNDWVSLDASNEAQLTGATAQGRCILTFNIRDFMVLAQRYPSHGGIVLAAQASWALPALIAATDRLLSETEAEDWVGQVRWLNDCAGAQPAPRKSLRGLWRGLDITEEDITNARHELWDADFADSR